VGEDERASAAGGGRRHTGAGRATPRRKGQEAANPPGRSGGNRSGPRGGARCVRGCVT
jgi:hypothetical protein